MAIATDKYKTPYQAMLTRLSTDSWPAKNDRSMLDKRLNIAVERWCAWEPLAGARAICSHYNGGVQANERVEKPDLTTVSAMQRRRLGTLARIVFHVLARCTGAGAQEPVVFSSFMGEIERTQGILGAIAANQPISPAAFSLSVHNAIGGQWSLAHGITAPMIALAPPANSPVSALLEAEGMLFEGEYPAINVVYYEEPYPEFYTPFLQGPADPVALALRLVPSSDAECKGLIRISIERLPSQGCAPDLRSNLAALADLLAAKRSSVLVQEEHCSWLLRRVD